MNLFDCPDEELLECHEAFRQRQPECDPENVRCYRLRHDRGDDSEAKQAERQALENVQQHIHQDPEGHLGG